MELIPIDSPQLTVFPLSGSYAYTCNRHFHMHMKMANSSENSSANSSENVESVC